MFGLELTFDRPAYFLLLLLLPGLWWISLRSMAGLGQVRQLTAIALRTLVFLLIICALAEVQLMRISPKLTVIYLLDQSESIPAAQRQAMIDYVVRDVREHRRRNREDRAGVIVFGAEARVEIPPLDDDLPSIGDIESYLDLNTEATNLEAALKLAHASFPEDAAKRVVIVSDGNENLGDARRAAQQLVDDGVGIDVVAVRLRARAEVAVEKISLPTNLRKGQLFEARVVLNNYASPDQPGGGRVRGKLRLTQQVGQQESPIGEMDVELEPGKNVFAFEHKIEHSAMFTYKAVFVPDDPQLDRIPQNNQATAYTYVRGEAKVLLIEDWEHRGEFDYLVNRLRAQNLDVTVQTTDQLFSNGAELLEYDTIVLANVPRSSSSPDRQGVGFSDEQIRMLVENTQQMGCGLVMLGGDRAFGAGGWVGTELEKAMPVDFEIRNARVQAVGALVLMMHASEMAQGNHWQKVVAREALQALGPMDYCGLLHWDNQLGRDEWLWGRPQGLVRIGNQKQQMMAMVDRMFPGDMPDFEPSMRKALAAFKRVNASVKLMIVISDGDPSPPSLRTVTQYQLAGIPVTTVAIGAHGPAEHQTLRRLATATGGKYYAVNNPKALPRIYQREVRRVTRPLIYEPESGVRVQVAYPHEMLGQLDPAALRPLRGYVLTTLKDSPLVEQILVADRPQERENSTLLAAWTYGLGRAVVFTSDAGHRWADLWTSAPYYDKFFSDIIRWSMRPVQEEANFHVATDVRDGKVRLVVTALDKNDEFLNFLEIQAKALTPSLNNIEVPMRQVAPGRYVGEFDASEPGSYLYAIVPGGRYGTLRGGVNVPYGREYQDRETNMGLLTSLVSLRPREGQPGEIIDAELSPANFERLLQVDTFRHNLQRARSSRDMWPWAVVVCAVVFFADVFVRRVQISFGWLAALLVWLRLRSTDAEKAKAEQQRLERLRARKREIAAQIEQRRAAARFEPAAEEPASGEPSPLQATAESGPAKPAAPQTPTLAPQEQLEDSYTARLLRAKKEALKKRRLEEQD